MCVWRCPYCPHPCPIPKRYSAASLSRNWERVFSVSVSFSVIGEKIRIWGALHSDWPNLYITYLINLPLKFHKLCYVGTSADYTVQVDLWMGKVPNLWGMCVELSVWALLRFPLNQIRRFSFFSTSVPRQSSYFLNECPLN